MHYLQHTDAQYTVSSHPFLSYFIQIYNFANIGDAQMIKNIVLLNNLHGCSIWYIQLLSCLYGGNQTNSVDSMIRSIVKYIIISVLLDFYQRCTDDKELYEIIYTDIRCIHSIVMIVSINLLKRIVLF